MRENVLLASDAEPQAVAGYKGSLRVAFDVETAGDPEAALEKLKAGAPFAALIADFSTGGPLSAAFLAKARQLAGDTRQLVLAPELDPPDLIELVNQARLFRILPKPCSGDALREAVEAAAEEFRSWQAEKELLNQTLRGSIRVLTDVLKTVNPPAFDRASRVQRVVRFMLRHLPRQKAWEIDVSAMLCQTGMVAVPVELARKLEECPCQLTPEELAVVEKHPQTGGRLLRHLPKLTGVAANVEHQLRRYREPKRGNSSGRGQEMPFGAAVLKVALDYDALVQQGASSEEAIAEMNQRKGWYEPSAMAALQATFVKVKEGFALRFVKVDDLSLGMVLREEIKSANGNILVGAGEELSESLLAKVKNFARWQPVAEPICVLVPTQV